MALIGDYSQPESVFTALNRRKSKLMLLCCESMVNNCVRTRLHIFESFSSSIRHFHVAIGLSGGYKDSELIDLTGLSSVKYFKLFEKIPEQKKLKTILSHLLCWIRWPGSSATKRQNDA